MQEIQSLMKKFIKELDYEPINLMFKQIKMGKGLRSKLILNIAKNTPFFERKKDEIHTLCAVIELVHLASLLHDDVIDEAKLRRGALSINASFGAKNAIMLGDILYSKAFFELSHFDKAIASSVSNAVVRLSKGELMDVYLSAKFNENEQDYLEMIACKTAALIESASFCAAFLCELNTKEFSEYGKNLGIAFQIVDDILDITSDEKTLGKPAMNDFKEGKTTLPYILFYQNAKQDDKEKLKSLFKQNLSDDEAKWLSINLAPFVKISMQKAKEFGNKALKAIEKYPNEKLAQSITQMLDRSF